MNKEETKSENEIEELQRYAVQVGFAYSTLNLFKIGFLKASEVQEFSLSSVPDDTRDSIEVIQQEIETEGFKLIKYAGNGAQGTVVIAQNSNKRYALKCVGILNKIGKEDQKLIQQVDEEIKAMQKIKSDYVVPFLYSFQKKYHKYIVMEECMGSLEELVQSLGGKMNENTFIKYGREILQGIKDIHDQGLVLRDIKLDNILIDCQGRIKFCDLGMAGNLNAYNSFIQSSSIKGNYLFSSPEICQSLYPEFKMKIEEIYNKRKKEKSTNQLSIPIEKQSKKSDIYSIGLVLINLLGATPYQIISKKQLIQPEDFVPSIQEFKNKEKIKDLIKGLNQYLPEDRLSSQQAIEIFSTLDFSISQNQLFNQVYLESFKKFNLPQDQQDGFFCSNKNQKTEENQLNVVYTSSFQNEPLIVLKNDSFIPLNLYQKAQNGKWKDFFIQKIQDEDNLFVPYLRNRSREEIVSLNISFLKNQMKSLQKKLLENIPLKFLLQKIPIYKFIIMTKFMQQPFISLI